MDCFVSQDEKGDKELFSVYVPTNHIYVGDIFLLEKCDIIRPNLSVREGLGEIHGCRSRWTPVHGNALKVYAAQS